LEFIRVIIIQLTVNYPFGQRRLIVPMVNESIAGQNALELATFGEVLYAFSSLRSTSGRRRGSRGDTEMLPWSNIGPDAAADYEVPPIPRRALAPVPERVDPPAPRRLVKPRRASGRCTCGQCRTCMENARWERIFQEKFANSDYYNHEIRIHYASPLSSI
jgi:hypothetical protein